MALVCAATVLCVSLLAGQAGATQSGGAPAPATGGPRANTPGSGGARYRAPDHGRPRLAVLSISRSNLFAYGRAVRINFKIRDRSRRVRVRLDFIRESDNRVVYRANLGRVRTGVTHSFRWHGTEGNNTLRQDRYRVRVVARDAAGNKLIRGQASANAGTISFRAHRFPVAGLYSFGGAGARYGASRPGHTHNGQDLPAAVGTPVVAPRAGEIVARGYDAGAAGNYLVLKARGEDFSYVFMHLQTGSLRVGKGDTVYTGQRIANVGNTGYSTGPHLHFEIWRGAWFAGGSTIDPLPALKAWARGG